MLRQRSGQVFIEYIMVVLLVCLAILIGGPVLKRAIFGAFKSQEDSVMDSFSEQLRQSTTSMIPTPVCGCNSYTDDACGTGQCSPTEMHRYRTCTPIDCDTEDICESRITCCTTPGVQQIGCGSIVSGTAENDDYPGYTRGAYNTTYFTAGFGTFDGTIYDTAGTGADTHDCLLGEMIVSRTCGRPPAVGGNIQVFACQRTSPVTAEQQAIAACKPGCSGIPASASSACNGTSEYYRNGGNLTNEVGYRKKGGVISGGILTLDNPQRGIQPASSSTFANAAYALANPPYGGSSGSDTDRNIYLGSFLMPWTYFLTASECSSGPTPPARACERLCPSGDIPTTDHKDCISPRCDQIAIDDVDSAIYVNGAMSFLTEKLIVPDNIVVDASAYNLNFIMGCFDAAGNLMAGGVNSSRIHLASVGPCTSEPFNVSGQAYCFEDGSTTTGVPTNTSGVCVQATQTAIRLYNPAPTAAATDIMSYTINYEKRYIGSMVRVLADNYVDIYESNSVWTRGKLLYSTPRLSYALPLGPAWRFPAEFYAEASSGGRIYLLVYHYNESTEPSPNPGGVSLQKSGHANGSGCFIEDGTSFNTGGAMSTPSAGAWYNNGCWIYGASSELNNASSNPHIIQVRANVDGAGTCSSPCSPTCTPPYYCVAGACQCVPDCNGKVCGTDGCGGSCGSCETNYFCNASYQCQHNPVTARIFSDNTVQVWTSDHNGLPLVSLGTQTGFSSGNQAYFSIPVDTYDGYAYAYLTVTNTGAVGGISVNDNATGSCFVEYPWTGSITMDGGVSAGTWYNTGCWMRDGYFADTGSDSLVVRFQP